MPEYVVTVTKRISCTAEVTVRAEDEDAFGAELEELVEAGGDWRDTETEYDIEEVNAA